MAEDKPWCYRLKDTTYNLYVALAEVCLCGATRTRRRTKVEHWHDTTTEKRED